MADAPEIAQLAESLVRKHGRDARMIATRARLAARQQHDAATEKAWDLVLREITSLLDPHGSSRDARALLMRLDPTTRRSG